MEKDIKVFTFNIGTRPIHNYFLSEIFKNNTNSLKEVTDKYVSVSYHAESDSIVINRCFNNVEDLKAFQSTDLEDHYSSIPEDLTHYMFEYSKENNTFTEIAYSLLREGGVLFKS